MSKIKHIPTRSCMGCGQSYPKRELVRIVHNIQGYFEVDPSGKKAGRGSYLCPRPSCWDKRLKRGRLEHALRGKMASEDYQTLLDYSRNLKEAG